VSRRHTATGDAGTLAVYLRDISRLPRLTADEERELGSRIQRDRDDAAVAHLVEANLRFVVSCAKRYRGCGVPAIDLIHEGNVGLLIAARRFDPSRNVKFITYAVWWIRQAMVQVLAGSTRAFCVPPKLLAEFRRCPGDVSLSDPLPGGTGRPRDLSDTIPFPAPAVDEDLIREADLVELAGALLDLDDRERLVVRLRFGLDGGEPWTLRQIGDRLHLTRERVRQIEASAKDKLRRSAKLHSHLN
jgi:RNA polymerase primary sigma factor